MNVLTAEPMWLVVGVKARLAWRCDSYREARALADRLASGGEGQAIGEGFRVKYRKLEPGEDRLLQSYTQAT